jgi:hypothetical protein
MPISVVDPVGPAIERTKKILFRPFDLGKWCVLGFGAFLANLGEGGAPNFGSGGRGGGGGARGGEAGGDSRQVVEWTQQHLALILAIALAALIVGIAIGLLLTWLSSRGKFMFLDGIVRNRAAVVKPWKEFRPEANSLFLFRVLVGLATFVCLLLAAGLAIGIAWPDISAGAFRGSAFLALGVGIPLALLIALVASLINLFLLDFVVPIMYLRRLPVVAAWGVFRDVFLADRVGTLVLYVLFKIVIAICVGMLAFLVTCATCCIAALPYIGTVILLPLLVFGRAYPLYFIKQFGPNWNVFRPPTVLPVQAAAPDDPRHPPDDRYFTNEG